MLRTVEFLLECSDLPYSSHFVFHLKTFVTETSFETNTLLLLQLLLKFCSNILQIEYQMLVLAPVLAFTDSRKYEATIPIYLIFTVLAIPVRTYYT